MMAKAVATESQMNFISVKGPELFSKWVGESEKQIRELFRKAREAAPCVVFFDEIDSVAANREGSGGSGGGASSVGARVLSQLLNEMDGIDAISKKKHLIVMAATNRPEVLDAAIMRPGRFDRLLYIPLPDEAARLAIFKKEFGKMTNVERGVLDCDLFLDEIVDRTEGFSGAETVNICKEAALMAIREVIQAGEVEIRASTAKETDSEKIQKKEEEGNHTVTKNEGNSTEQANPRPNLLVGLRREHIFAALDVAKPRISKETIAFYDNFEKTSGVKA
jgi:transitional endoplasmic reticulum ATPase